MGLFHITERDRSNLSTALARRETSENVRDGDEDLKNTSGHVLTRSGYSCEEARKQGDEASHRGKSLDSIKSRFSWRRACCGVGALTSSELLVPLLRRRRLLEEEPIDMDVNFGPQEQVLWPASILAGVLMSGAVYEIARKVSSRCFKSYNGLNRMQKVEWNNRCFSTVHALVVAAVSFYLVVISDLFNENVHNGMLIDRKSWLSDAMFGVSIGYFLMDLAMILWYFPKLGGKEYLFHHGLSIYALGLALLSGKAHVYILMVLFTEVTTPCVNLRWYLDVAGQKNSNLYVYNGLALFAGWLIARILLFGYIFSHMYFHFDELKSVFTLGFYSVMAVPSAVAVMNVLWFWKICKGMVKTLSKRKKHSENGKIE
ncbi:hypothetical protein QOZ80_1AG0037700 [Eleusine coracana subsp. coracana]|nr:hypothetical protein QOZ80_1AG0037700 [Eleusine coracana subsp. coracana]